jgi:glycerate dehydrogenase
MKIVLLERDSIGQDMDVTCFEELGEVVSYHNTVSAQEVRERIAEADIVIANKAPLTEESLRDAKQLKLICVLATGYDNCDAVYAKSRGIKVTNVRDYSTAMVAQHTFTLALSVSQKLVHYDRYVKSGAYSGQNRFSNFDVPFCELDGKTWGIVGMGNIGRRVARIAETFGCQVIFHSLTGKSNCTDYEQVDRDALFARSDFLSLHCPLSELSKDLINAEALKKMKKSAILINVARGPIVNQEDLYHALTEEKIAGAGLDVLEKEPMSSNNPLGQITDSGKLIITPHLAWASVEARNRCVMGVYENIRAFQRGENRNVVNL